MPSCSPYCTGGARVSETIGLRVAEALLDRASAVHLHGKGRKERVVPLGKSTAAQLRGWFLRIDRSPDARVFLNRLAQRLSRSGVEHRLRVTIARASERCPSLRGRRISPHTFRHTTAIALWLGHEDPATTHMYVQADLAMKEAALRRLDCPGSKPVRFRATDGLLAFLEAL